MNDDQYQKIQNGRGFIAALDQSGGSTPKALKLYGIEESEYSGDDEMFAPHARDARAASSRARASTATAVLGAILFEGTMDREIEGKGSAEYLWS